MKRATHNIIIIVLSFIAISLMGFWSIYTMYHAVMDERTARITVLLDLAKAQLTYFHQKERSGELTRAQAQDRARESIFAQQTKTEYFILRDLSDSRLLSHATHARIGKIDLGLRLPDGRTATETYLEKLKDNPEGKAYIFIYTQRPNSNDPLVYKKLNGATVFTPWGWIVSTGFFVDDLHALFWKRANLFFIVGATLLIVLSATSAHLIRPFRND